MTATPTCPRCGYDLSGQVVRWNFDESDACPLTGKCSECGLDFDWAGVFDPLRDTRCWSFEHAPRGTPLAAFRAARRALVPPLLWRGLRIEHPVVVRRLVQLACGYVLAVHVTLVVVRTGLTVREDLAVGQPLVLEEWWKPLLWPYGAVESRGARIATPLFLVFGLLPLLWAMLTPIAFLLLGESLSKAKVRRIHLLRGVSYSLTGWSVMLVAFGTVAMVMDSDSRLGVESIVSFALSAILSPAAWVVAIALWPCWFTWHWWGFTRTYLRFPHDLGVVVSLLIISGLATLLAGVGLALAGQWLDGH